MQIQPVASDNAPFHAEMGEDAGAGLAWVWAGLSYPVIRIETYGWRPLVLAGKPSRDRIGIDWSNAGKNWPIPGFPVAQHSTVCFSLCPR